MSYVRADARVLKSAHPRTGCALPDASAAGSRDHNAATSAECASQADSEASADGGRPKVSIKVRSLIRRMSVENPLWGAPRIHGELLKLGIEVAQSTVAKYMA